MRSPTVPVKCPQCGKQDKRVYREEVSASPVGNCPKCKVPFVRAQTRGLLRERHACPTCGVFITVLADGRLHARHKCKTPETIARSEDYRRGYWTGFKAGQASARQQDQA